jgi:hypothetical protein
MATYTPAKDSTEHARSIRAEYKGGFLIILGISLAYGVQPTWAGFAVAGIGLVFDLAALGFAWYGRSKIKAAAVSPPSVTKLHQRRF